MPIDRAATLRNAEKLLRQGKLDQAIAEYLRIVEDQPRDWNTANVLGDLYVRAGKADRAVEQYSRIADSLNEEGFYSKAAALYKKILKLRPDDEHALVQSGEVAATQGLLADARTYLNLVAERRRSRGDVRGVAQMRIRLGSLDPTDFEARANAARARAEIGDAAAALTDLKTIAAELTAKGRDADAIEVLRAAAALDPEDEEIRERLLAVYIAAGDFERARACASTKEQFQAIAASLDAKGRVDEALSALREAAALDPGDAQLRAHLARSFVARGNLDAAAEYLTPESAGDDPQLLLTVAELRIRGGALDDGLAIVRRLVNQDPERRESVAFLGWSIAEQSAEAGFRIVEVAADAAVAQSDWPGAAAALQEFVTRVPNHTPALMRLVEICVDGGLEATMYSAQAQLADAYIAAGAAAEARFIAEDLVAREPWDRANVERFRRALVLLGEPDPDALIAERLSGQSPFMSTDLSFGELPRFEEVQPGDAKGAPPAQAAPPPAEPPAPPSDRSRPQQGSHFELSANAIDVESILGDLGKTPKRPPERPRSERPHDAPEIDLSVDLDGVFAHMRGEASKQQGLGDAEASYKNALALRDAGRIDEAIAALEAASRSPRLRFNAASQIARIYRDRKAMPQAIEWFERAAEAPSPTRDDGYLLLYELADALEAVGEVARALAVCMELQAEAGEYRDVSERIDRLAKVQTRG